MYYLGSPLLKMEGSTEVLWADSALNYCILFGGTLVPYDPNSLW